MAYRKGDLRWDEQNNLWKCWGTYIGGREEVQQLILDLQEQLKIMEEDK